MADKQENNTRSISDFITKFLFLKWLKLFRKGLRKNVEINDVNKLWPYSKSEKLGVALEIKYNEAKTKKKNVSIAGILWRCFGTTYFLYGLFQVSINIFIKILAEPYLIGKIVSFFTPKQEYLMKDALFYITILVLLRLFDVFYQNNFAVILASFGIKIRTTLCCFVYKTILNLNSHCLADFSGEEVALITQDVRAIEMFTSVGNSVWICIIKVIVTCYVLYLRIGYASLVGIGCFVLVVPAQIYLRGKVKALKTTMSKETNERLETLQEILAGIRLLKMYSWEKFFAEKINTHRQKEVKVSLKLLTVKLVILVLENLNSGLALFATLITYIKLENNISAEIVYSMVFIFKYLVILCAAEFPDAIHKTVEALAAIKRFDLFLKQIEMTEAKTVDTSTQSPTIILENVTVTVRQATILRNICTEFSTGLTIISGPVGCGKSILLKTLLHEYSPNEGKVTVEGSISYCSQEPWLFPATIKENILLGQEYNAARYQKVLRICALSHDLQNGDDKVLEDRDANLSKSQQSRICLARAVYKNSDVYLLDNSLAALDTNLAASVFKECIQEFLGNKIVVLVTHNPNFIKEADKVVFLENGTISTFKESEVKIEEQLEEIDYLEDDVKDEGLEENDSLLDSNEQKLFYKKRKSGKVAFSTYIKYAKFGGGFLVAFFVFCSQSGVGVLTNYRDIFISKWVNFEEGRVSSENFTKSDLTGKHQEVFTSYSFVIGGFVVASVLQSTIILFFSRNASIKIHESMVKHIMGAPMEFFDNNFSDNILDRFSKNLSSVDETIPFFIINFFQNIFLLTGLTIVIAFVNLSFLVPVTTLFCLMFLCRKYTVKTRNNLKRLEMMSTSLVVGHMNATLEGLTTIRAFNVEETVVNFFYRRLDICSSASYALQGSNKAFNFMLDSLSAIFNAIIVVKFFVVNEDVEAGYVGLVISNSFFISKAMNMAFFFWTVLENQMTSVERILEYTDIPQESSKWMEIENWPQYGRVVFHDVYLSYPSSDKYVLNNVNLTVEPEEKIGIVGHMGAGKSSLISTLVRLYNIEGKVTIDDVDIKIVSLNFLRSHISIIPKEPIVFSGSVRDNLDPLKQFSDEEIWAAVSKVGLKKQVTSLGLRIRTNSLNFSVGEKQLLAIARAILHKNKIVALDEATANTDAATEKLIYEAIYDNFSNCTVFTVARRLQTVLKCDRIVVLDKGMILECARPEVLLKDKGSVFYKMVESAGLLEETSQQQFLENLN